MSFSFRPAKREAVNLLIAIAGSSGSGKTFSALRLAHGLSGGRPFAAIDTENGRMLHYAEGYGFKFEHGPMSAPYSPARYIEALDAAEAAGYPVIVLDSFTHEWDGIGGCCDMHDAEVEAMVARILKRRPDAKEWDVRQSVKIAAWAMPKAEHRKLMARLLQCRAHLVFCLRADNGKIDIQRTDGKTEVVPKRVLGWASEWIPITEKRFIYEMTSSFVLSPDKPGYPIPIKLQDQHKAFFPLDAQISEKSGEQLSAWAKGGTTASGASQPEQHASAVFPGATGWVVTGGVPSKAEVMAAEYVGNIQSAATMDEAKSWYSQAFKRKAEFGEFWPLVETAKDAAKQRLGL